jgi:hypothetical protein
LLGAGPGASLAKQNFATGVPSLLQATPLGVGLSALDYAHARATNDPGGAAAAAIGLMPGAGPELKAGAKAAKLIPWKDETDKALISIEHALDGLPAPQFHPQPIGGGAKPKPQDTDVALSAIHDALNPGTPLPDWMAPVKPPAAASYVKQDPHVGDFTVFDKSHKPVESFPTEEKAKKFAAKWDQSFSGMTNTQATLPSKEGYTLSSAANKDFPESAKDYFIHDPAGKKVGDLTYVEEEKHNAISSTPAHWQLSMEGVAPKVGSSLDDLMNYIPSWHKQTLAEKSAGAAKPPVFDYEKDDNGLYHIFDAVSGKTHTVKDTESQAKAWINEQKAKSAGFNLMYGSDPVTIPITESKSPAPAVKPFDEDAYKGYPTLPAYWKPNPEFDSKVTGLIRKDFTPVDWKNYTPPNARNEAVTPKLAVDPTHVESLGGNPKVALWKGGSLSGYPQELPDMTGKVVSNNGESAKEKFEKGFFLADRPSVANQYTTGHDAGPSPYVALPKNVVETDWTDLAKKFKDYSLSAGGAAHYSPIMMKYIIDAAREHGADMAIVHNIHDIGGPQTQYVVLNTNVLRAPTAKFDPSKLHLRYPLAGLAGAGIYTAAQEGEEKQ